MKGEMFQCVLSDWDRLIGGIVTTYFTIVHVYRLRESKENEIERERLADDV
jgi:hypothetical protein